MPYELEDANGNRYRLPASLGPDQLHVGGQARIRFVRGYGSTRWYSVLDGVREPEALHITGVLATDRDDAQIQELLDELEEAAASAVRLYYVDHDGLDARYLPLLGALPVIVSPDGIDGSMLTITLPVVPAGVDWKIPDSGSDYDSGYTPGPGPDPDPQPCPEDPSFDDPPPVLVLSNTSDYDAFALVARCGSRIVVVGRRGDNHTEGGEIYQWISDDHGETYVAELIYNTNQGSGWENRTGGAGGVTPTGRIVALVNEYESFTGAQTNCRPLWSDDGGETWTVGSVISGARRFYGPLVALPSGRLMATDVRVSGSTFGLDAWFSDDDGETWGDQTTIISVAGSSSHRPNEPAAALVDGDTDGEARILLVYRNQGGAMHQILSEDGGATWGSPVKLPFSHDDVSGSLEVDVSPWMGLLEDGRLLLVWGERKSNLLRWTAGVATDVVSDVNAWETPRTLVKAGALLGAYPWVFRAGATDASLGLIYYSEENYPTRTDANLNQLALDVTAGEPPTHECLLLEGSGTSVENTGSLLDGTVSGASWVSEGLSFDGTDDGVELPPLLPAYAPAAKGVTLLALANPANPGQGFEAMLANLTSAGGVSLEFRNSAGPRIRTIPPGGGASQSVEATVDTSGWLWIAGVLDPDADEARIYVNGVLEATGSYHGGTIAASDNLYLGRTPTGAYYEGSIAFARAYPRALSTTELEALYDSDIALAAGKGITLPARP